MKLQELYKHRTDFTIIGLTGRTGSGCTKVAELLSKDFEKNKISSESNFIKGLEDRVENISQYKQRDLSGHNHPNGSNIFSPSDIKASLKLGFKKIVFLMYQITIIII